MIRRIFPLLISLLFSATAFAQPTYTAAEAVASAPLAWQVHSDPASRLSIGQDDGNVFASPDLSAFASTIRYGGAQGLEGLLYDFAIDPAGPPAAFGLARAGCQITDLQSMEACLRVRWTPTYLFGGLVMVATVSLPTYTISHLEYGVSSGDSFSIERLGNSTVNFYRSTGTPGERRRVYSFTSPFGLDGGTGNVEVRAFFEPEGVARKLSLGQELYYCCL